MDGRSPHFIVGDLVSEKAAVGRKRIGSIVQIYSLGGQFRYVVQFDDGSESVYFDFELDEESPHRKNNKI
jgi:hypothetical protein